MRPATDPSSPPSPDPQPRGVYHTLRRGQTLYALSRAYQVPVPTLMEVNGITDATKIRAGSRIFIPGAARQLSISLPGGSSLAWPLRGRVTSGFGSRGRGSLHEGIDIDGVMGQDVRATAAGKVIRARSGRGYGLFIKLDHGGGLTSLYAHASELLVREGDWVEQGDPIARVGRSGNARGTHLHFEVRRDGRPLDPLHLLRGS